LKNASIDPDYGFSNHGTDNIDDSRHFMATKRPEDWSSEDKLKAVLEAASIPDEQLGAYLRKKGIHETHLQQWRVQMLNGLDKLASSKKTKRSNADIKKIRSLEKELNRKDKALAETAALLVLKKKVQEIWGDEDD
jgi:transposase-like protein